MNRHAVVTIASLAVGAAGAVALPRHSSFDPYVRRLEARVQALLPDVERELGAPVPGPIRIVVSTRGQLGELTHREMRGSLRAIEGETPEGTAHDADRVPRSVDGEFGCVDEDGTIHVCREELEGAPHHGDLAGALDDMLFGTGKVQGSEVVDGVIVHELVHVYQVRAFGLWAYLRGAHDRSDLLARCAVAEGHAEAVQARVSGTALNDAEKIGKELAKLARIAESYGNFEIGVDAQCLVFTYVQGRSFVESAITRLGRDAAVRRLFDEAPSLLQIAHPETWPGARAPDAGTDAVIRRARTWLDTEWKKTECEPLPPSVFLQLLGPASVETQKAATDALLEVQRIDTAGAVEGHAMRGHLLAAGDEAGARTLLDAWVETARARDAMVPRDPFSDDSRVHGEPVLESAWTDAQIDGRPALLVTRRYHALESRLEHAVVARRGRYVLELRLVDDPGGAPAVLRLARRFLACVADEPSDPSASGWGARWRVASDPRSAVERLRPLLVDSDADVRHAALWNLLRRGALAADERDRGRHDADPLVRLTALTGCASGAKPDDVDLLAAIDDRDPRVAAGGWYAAQAHDQQKVVSGEAIARALRRPEVTVRRAASRLLEDWSYGSADEGLALVRTALADGDPGVREHGASGLSEVPPETAGLDATYSELLTGTDETLRKIVLAILFVRDQGVPGTAAALTSLLDNDEHAVEAVYVLGKLGDEALSAAPRIRRFAEDAERAGETWRRLQALVALAGITGDRTEIVGVVRRLLATGADEDARLAAEDVDKLGDAAADLVPDLVKRMAAGHRGVVLPILDALENLGAAAAPALPAIEPLCSSEDPIIGRRARSARDEIRNRIEAASRK